MITSVHDSMSELFSDLSPRVPIMTRQDRLELLRDLIARHDYRTQAELIAALASHQVHLTQSSISRDIKALELAKIDGVYRLPEEEEEELAPTLPPFSGAVWHHLLALHCVGDHLLVLRVKPATAQLVGAALDALPLPGMAGTIAGDDTIFVALKDRPHQQALAHRLRQVSGML